MLRRFVAGCLALLVCFAYGQGGNLGALRDDETSTYTAILTPGDQNESTVTAKVGETIIASTSSNSFDPALEVVDGSGTVLAKNDDVRPGRQDALVLVRVPNGGPVKILVKSYKGAAGGQFTLNVRRFVSAEAKVGGTVAGSVAKSGIQWLRFPATKFSTYVALAQFSGYQPDIQVFNPNGEQLGAEFRPLNVSRTRRTAFRVDMDGDYYLRLDTGGQPGTRYSLTIRQAREMKISTSATSPEATLERGGMDIYKFDAKAGSVLRVDAGTDGGEVETAVQFISPAADSPEIDGDPLVVLDSVAKDPGARTVLIRRSGTYQVPVWQPLDLPTSYHLSLTGGARSWDSSEATSSLALGDSDYWSFSGSDSEIISLMGAANQFDLKLNLYDLNGTEIGVNDDGGKGRNSLLTALLPSAGRYLLRVSAFGDGGSGNYHLVRSDAAVKPLVADSKAQGSIGPGATEIWSFKGKTGQSILVSARSDDFMPVMKILGPDGLVYDEVLPNSSGPDSLMSLQLPADGVYTIWVTGQQGGGKYNIRWIDLG